MALMIYNMPNMKDSNDRRSPVTDEPLRYPGQSLDEELEIIRLKRYRNLSIFVILLAVAGYELLHAYFGVPPRPILAILLVLASGIYFLFADAQLRKDARNKEQGSLGEKAVAEILDNLKKEGSRVFHDVMIEPNYNIDHVILSRHGIFIVETKTISKPKKGQVNCNGEAVFLSGKNPDRIPIDQAVNNARSLSSYLNEKTGRRFRVKPVLVYPGWFVEDYANSRIWVLNPKILQHYINREPETISEIDYDKAELHLSTVAR